MKIKVRLTPSWWNGNELSPRLGRAVRLALAYGAHVVVTPAALHAIVTVGETETMRGFKAARNMVRDAIEEIPAGEA